MTAPKGQDSEVKGIWFVSMRAWLDQHVSEDQRRELSACLSPPFRAAFAEPLVSEWYPEAMLEEALLATYEVVAVRDRARFLSIMEACTEIGVNRFFRLLLRLSTLSFVTKLVPTMWKQIRRGRGDVKVAIEGDRARLEYSDFPRFVDPLYELMTIGSLRALVRISTGREPVVEVVARNPEGLVVAIGTRGSLRP
jgi:hypothetical protein